MEYPFNNSNSNISAIQRFQLMLKTNDVLFFDAEDFETIIHHYLEYGKIALAKKAIKLGLQQHPTSINLKLFKVEIYTFENKLKKAHELLDELHIIEPLNEEIYIQKANVLSKQDNHVKAIKSLEKALELTNDPADVLSLMAMEYLFLNNLEHARDLFAKCIEYDTEDYASLYNLMFCFDSLNKHQEAIDFLNVYLDSNPYCEVAWHQLGKQYYTIKDYKKALAAFDFAIISDDTFVGAYIEKGKTLEKLHAYTEAIENYILSLELEDPTSFALLRLGKCYERLDKIDLALQYYYKTVHEDPLLDKGWIAITKFYNSQKNYKKALYYINKAIDIDPENVIYWKLYSQINQRLNLFEEAERGYKKTLELGNYELDTWLSRGDLLIKLGEPEAAVYNYLQALEFYPEEAEIEYRLAGLYYSLHQRDKGLFHLKNGLRYNSDYAFIIEELFPKVYQTTHVKKLLKTRC